MSARKRPAAKRPAKALSRRRFVSLLAAGSAAVLAQPATAAPAPRGKKAAAPAPAPPSPEQKEFERQRANTLSTLKTIREYKLPPGGDLSVVFRPLPATRRSR